MELLASQCCALDPWQTTCMKLSLSTPMRDQVIHYLLVKLHTHTLKLRVIIQNQDIPLLYTATSREVNGRSIMWKSQNLSTLVIPAISSSITLQAQTQDMR